MCLCLNFSPCTSAVFGLSCYERLNPDPDGEGKYGSIVDGSRPPPNAQPTPGCVTCEMERAKSRYSHTYNITVMNNNYNPLAAKPLLALS